MLGLALGGAVLSNAFRMAAQNSFDAALQADMDGLIAAAEPDPNGGVMLANRFLNHNFDRDSNTIEVFIGRLRKKLDAGLIQTVRGLGYSLEDPKLGGTAAEA